MATAEGRPPTYLDYNATTPICEEAVQAMQAYLSAGWPHGNPSSGHGYGQQARSVVEESRQKVAAALSCSAEEIVFTSGGTESNNWAIIGAVLQLREQDASKNHIVTSSIEHPAVSEVCRYLEQTYGFEVTVVPVDSNGIIDVKAFEASLQDRTALVTVMHANNETGAIQPIALLSQLAKAKGNILVHTDAAQSIGKLPVSVVDLGVDLLSVCSHKFYGPKGVGALYIRSGITLKKLMHGAGHERGLRPGTENVLGILGMAVALELAHQRLADSSRHMQTTRDALHEALKAGLGADNVHLHGSEQHRLPNTLYVSLRAPGSQEWCKAAAVLYAVAPYLAASSGSACHSGTVCMSPSLNAMQVPTGLALGAMRLTTGRYLSRDDAVAAGEVLVQAVLTLKP